MNGIKIRARNGKKINSLGTRDINPWAKGNIWTETWKIKK